MHPAEKPRGTQLDEIYFEKMQKKREIAAKKHRQKTAAGNMEAVSRDYPDAKEMINIHLGEDYLPDPFNKQMNQAARVISKNQQAIKKVEHNYSSSVKKQIKRTKEQGQASVEKKSMATEIGRFGKFGTGAAFGVPFEGESSNMIDGRYKLPANSTGQRQAEQLMSHEDSGSQAKGPQYKFKNIHGDRGTFDGLSSQVQNYPPSSVWYDHPIVDKSK